jgi:thiamine biosynthesis lipoprotein
MRIDKHFEKVMHKSFEIYKDTRGRFDVTVKPLVQAWDLVRNQLKNSLTVLR